MVELINAISNKNIILSWVFGLCLLSTFFWKHGKYRHKRYRNRILVLAFTFGLSLSFYLSGTLPVSAGGAIILLWGIHALVSYLTTEKSMAIFPETLTIAYMKNLVRRCEYAKLEKRFPQRPFWIMSIPGKREWGLLWVKKLLGQEQVRQAYEIYSGLLKLPLFEQEVDELRRNQVEMLLMLGDTIGAKSTFEKIDPNQKRNRESLILQSFLDERAGDFEKAREGLLLATREYTAEKDTSLARVYNNLGRMEKLLGNTTNVLHYYHKSTELARGLEYRDLIHVAYPNLIDTYLLMDDKPRAAHFLTEYSKVIDKESVSDLLPFHNYKVGYARQIKDRALFLESLVIGRVQLLPKISEEERLIFEISELRIRWNGFLGWEEKLFCLQHYLPKYLELEFPSSYYSVKEIFNILLELARKNNLGPFEAMSSQLLEFMAQSKERISRYLLDLPDYCVEERCYWEKERVYLRRIIQSNESKMNLKELFEGIFEHLRRCKEFCVNGLVLGVGFQ